MKTVQIVLLTILLGGLLLPSFASAQPPLVRCGLTDSIDSEGNPIPRCTFCDLFVMFGRIVNFLFIQIIPVLAALMIAIGGVYYILSQGSPEKLTSAKKLFSSVAIGLLIAYGAWLIVNTFFMIIGITRWGGFGGGWWQINCPTTASYESYEPSVPSMDTLEDGGIRMD